VFCGDHLLCARLRPSNIDASAGNLQEVQRIVRQIRARWPKTSILLRADSGFCREELLAWCENNDVDYVFGFARNKRLRKIIGRAMQEAKQEHRRTGKPARVFTEFAYRTKKSWSRRLGLAGTEWAEAQADTIRLKLLKIAAQVRITARRIWVRYSCAYPWQKVLAAAWTALRC
jgi:hypothetical protein